MSVRNGVNPAGLAAWIIFCGIGCVTEAPKGVRGESCESRADCAGGLRCISNVCVIDEIPIAVNARQCVVTECVGPEQCTTDTDGRVCRSGICGCNSDGDCNNGTGTGGRFCVSNRCSRCQADTDCGMNMYCTLGQCRAMCRTSADCNRFFTCQSGRCEYTGCTSNRECAADQGNWRAVCAARVRGSSVPQPTCVVPCESDRDCGVTSTGGYTFERCVSGTCTYVGCESDAECRAQRRIAPLMPPAVVPTVTCQ